MCQCCVIDISHYNIILCQASDSHFISLRKEFLSEIALEFLCVICSTMTVGVMGLEVYIPTSGRERLRFSRMTIKIVRVGIVHVQINFISRAHC